MSRLPTLISASDKERIAEAVKRAELDTSAEIVPFVVGQSALYPEAGLRAGAVLGAITLLSFASVNIFSDLWLPFGIAECAFAGIAAFLLGPVLTLIPALRRLCISVPAMQRNVDERAALAFLSEEVFLTRNRTGILIFLSVFEHRVCILGDSGINQAVRKEEWEAIVQGLTSRVRENRVADGLVETITACGQLLVTHGLAIQQDDTNELDNNIRMSER